MSFGLTFDKLIIILVIAVLLIGPDRLPHYAAQLGRLARGVRDMASGAKDRMREEMGPEFDEIEWSKLDPRQYDPRRIIREALVDEPPEGPPLPRASASGRGATVAAAGAAGAAPGKAGLDAASAGATTADPDTAAEPEIASPGDRGDGRPRYVPSAYEQRMRARDGVRAAPYDAEST